MPTNPSAKKRIRRNEGRAVMNSARKGSMRTSVKKVELALAAGDAGAAEAALKDVQPKLARNAGKGLIKKNAAARKMSRLNARIKALKKA
jgi:small subunit ribosomal protein S20